jgi:putative transcriptional regulator
MIRILTWLVFVAWLMPAPASADQGPVQGKLLVATELVEGELFANTVVLMLHYDATGAFGLVVNRPTDVKPGELLADEEGIAGYSGTLFWGGPVHMDSLRALLHTVDPPDDAEKILESVYLVSFEDAVELGPEGPGALRLFIGYAGWAPGQLDYEMARGSWRVLPGSDELVFAEEPKELWKRLAPAREQRAAAQSLQDHAGDMAPCGVVEIATEM